MANAAHDNAATCRLVVDRRMINVAGAPTMRKIDELAVEHQLTSNIILTSVRVEPSRLPTTQKLVVAIMRSYQSSH